MAAAALRRSAAATGRRLLCHASDHHHHQQVDPLLLKNVENLAKRQLLRDLTKRLAKEKRASSVAPTFRGIASSWPFASCAIMLIMDGYQKRFKKDCATVSTPNVSRALGNLHLAPQHQGHITLPLFCRI
ncbi:hypothetical protein OsI_24668 [Oryza sativa Indica Group]|uniref:Uncharacterized protein n=2 Tax=Oryza sativa TaxID=4530 RepID=A3BFZ5_ORYSJ|nr:hypothetical protein OsI_24668 [Oryza sativa Indica Group]EAZ38484.1 hypothetical protein OsJ_22872 [Oryza sativa Japonica Group]